MRRRLRPPEEDLRETRLSSLPPLCLTPRGLPLSVLPAPTPMTEGDAFIPAEADERLQRHPVGAARLEDRDSRTPFADERTGYCTWRDIPSRVLEQVFDAEEIRRLWWGGSVVMSCLSERFCQDSLLIPQWQIQNSMWQYGWSFANEYAEKGERSESEQAIVKHACDVRRYNLFAQFCVGIRNFQFGDGFTAFLHHVRFVNEYGWAQWGRGRDPIYLDAKLAFVICKDDRHVLTIGFNPSSRGLLVAQVQLRQKRGNRWLYKLPAPVLEYALGRLRAAFNLPVWLVTGESAAEAIRRAYEEGKGPSDEALNRVRSFYGPPRSDVRARRAGREFALAA